MADSLCLTPALCLADLYEPQVEEEQDGSFAIVKEATKKWESGKGNIWGRG